MTLEKGAALTAVIGFAVIIAVAYTNLNNRLDTMGNQIAGIQDALGSAACNAILPRQIEAIEKNRKDALKPLEALSRQYDCGPHHGLEPTSLDTGSTDAVQNVSATKVRPEENAAQLSADLKEIDRKLNEDPFANN